MCYSPKFNNSAIQYCLPMPSQRPLTDDGGPENRASQNLRETSVKFNETRLWTNDFWSKSFHPQPVRSIYPDECVLNSDKVLLRGVI